MKLVTFEMGGMVQTGVVQGEAVLSAGSLFEASPGEMVGQLTDVRLLPPVRRPGKVVAVGLNYRDHAEETGQAVPERPLLFAKFPSSVIGPGAPIVVPSITTQVDYEAELAVVIGRTASRVAASDAIDHVLGYTCCNDVSARDVQLGDGQWVRGKSFDTFCPIGPWIVTPDELPDPQALGIRCLVNGELLQDSSTAQMIFSVAELIAFISEAITLDPGDIIATGTPPGVGFTRQPPVFLTPGDVVDVEIDGIGRLSNPVA